MARVRGDMKVDSLNEEVGQASFVDVPGEGIIDRSALKEEGIEIVSDKGIDKYARDLAFMEEMIEVEMHESTDMNASPIEDVYCNGVVQRFIRGVPIAVKRKFVQILADSKATAIRVDVGIQGDQVVNRVNKNTAVRYPFRVIRDDNPMGAAWLRQVLRQA